MKHSAKADFSDRADPAGGHDGAPASLSALPSAFPGGDGGQPEPEIDRWPGAVRLAILLCGAAITWSSVAALAVRL